MIKIAITKGRIQKQVTKLLENANYDVEPILNLGRELQIKTKDDLQIIFGKANDVITFLEHGIVDIGFVGNYYELLDLKIGQCIFALASYPDFSNKNFQRRKRIASKYPRVTKKYFAQKQEDIEIIKLEGSVELGPVVGLADAIVDIVETGNTLSANGLEIIEKISDISTRMIVNKSSFKFKKNKIIEMVERIEDAQTN